MNEAVTCTADITQTKTKAKIYPLFKRTFDFTFALVCTIALVPIFLIVMLLIKLDSKGKAIFTQNRIGKDGKTIKIYKFRTMVLNADKILEDMLKKDKAIRDEYTKYKKLENDPRVTKIGKILRKTSLDELPQILNILKGDMSLIGPRPYLHRELCDMEGYVEYITHFRPGLTGMWQASGRSDTTFQERLYFDKYYFEKFSMKLDFQIFIKTIAVVLDRSGAK